MTSLSDLQAGQDLLGLEPGLVVSVIACTPKGNEASQVIYKLPDGTIRKWMITHLLNICLGHGQRCDAAFAFGQRRLQTHAICRKFSHCLQGHPESLRRHLKKLQQRIEKLTRDIERASLFLYFY